MAPFDRAYATSYQFAIANTDNHVPFLRYLTLKNVLTMKSNLGITHPENLCTVAEIDRPSVIILLLIVWVCLTFAYTQSAPEEAGWGCTLRSFKVIQDHWNWYQSRIKITIIVHYCDAHYAYILSFPTYNDLLIENLHFYRFYSADFRLKPPQRSCSWDLWYESWYQ